jgi:hypothetical protein
MEKYTQDLAHLERMNALNRENVPILVKMKQGQDEASSIEDHYQRKRNDNVHDGPALTEAPTLPLLISRSTVEKLNETILMHAKEQADILAKIKNFRKSINLMEWEHSYLEMQKKNMEDHYTDLQLLRVTKNLQELITTGDSTEKQKHEQQLLESKLSYLGKNEHVTREKQVKITQSLQRNLRERQKENDQFQRQLSDLRTHIQIREDILATRKSKLKTTKLNSAQPPPSPASPVSCSTSSPAATAPLSVTSPAGPSKRGSKHNKLLEATKTSSSLGSAHTRSDANAKMKAITVRRKLVDLAKAQTEEIEFMRQELDRLRRRTFPSFVQPGTTHPHHLAPDDAFFDDHEEEE